MLFALGSIALVLFYINLTTTLVTMLIHLRVLPHTPEESSHPSTHPPNCSLELELMLGLTLTLVLVAESATNGTHPPNHPTTPPPNAASACLPCLVYRRPESYDHTRFMDGKNENCLVGSPPISSRQTGCKRYQVGHHLLTRIAETGIGRGPNCSDSE